MFLKLASTQAPELWWSALKNHLWEGKKMSFLEKVYINFIIKFLSRAAFKNKDRHLLSVRNVNCDVKDIFESDTTT